MRDANTAACVLKREQAAMRGRERRRRRPRRPRWQFTWTHQRCDPCQLAQHALPQHVQPLGAAPRALGSLPDSSGPSSRARALATYQRRRGTAPGVCQQASIDHELRLQAPQHGWSRRRVFVRSVLGPTVEPCGDDRCVVARHATVSGLGPKQRPESPNRPLTIN